MKRTIWILAVPLSLLIVGGCAQSNPHRTYPKGSMGTAMRVERGEIVSIQTIMVDGRHSAVGTLGGALVGSSIGRSMGGGSGKDIAGAVGAVGGAVAGRAAERAATTKTAIEVIVQLDNGQVIAIIQQDNETLKKGDRVRVMRGRRANQVVPI